MCDRIIAYVNVDVEQRDELAPLYRPLDDFGSLCLSFVQLDLADGEISFVVEAPFNSHCPDTCRRWQVPAALRGDQLEPLAEKLRPLMQPICDGPSPDAMRAISDVDCVLSAIDTRDPVWIANIWPVDDFVDGQPIPLTAESTDADLDRLEESLKDEADSEKIVLSGSIRDALEIRREALRKDKKAEA